MQNTALPILLALIFLTITGCSPQKTPNVLDCPWNISLTRTYPQSLFLTVSATQETFSETKNLATKNYRIGEEKTVYANTKLLTVSNKKEQIISLPYVRVKENMKLAYIAPKTASDMTASKKVQFLELDKNLTYPLFELAYLEEEQKIQEKEIQGQKITGTEERKALSPSYVLVGNIFIGLNTDLSLAETSYLFHKQEFVPLEWAENTNKNKTKKIPFMPINKSKKTALSENNYSIVYVGKNGNILQFRKIYTNTDKKAEYCELKMTSPQLQVFGHKILVQTATREALHCIIQN